MTLDQWNGIQHFKPSDSGFGDVSKIDYQIVSALDRYRDLLNVPILVTFGTQGVHLPDSQHYLGLAVDVVFPGQTLSALAGFFHQATTCGFFHGVGIYPAWKYQGIDVGGLHLDVRSSGGLHTWMGVPGDCGNQSYIAASPENFKLYNLL